MDESSWLYPGNFLLSAQVVMALVTAGATIALWYVTRVLAAETRKMAELSSQPQVVVTIQPNQWSVNHFDITVSNTGNAVAHDISVSAKPIFKDGLMEDDDKSPIKKISILSPSQSLNVFFGDAASMLDLVYRICVTWRKSPKSMNTEQIIYDIDMSNYKGFSTLGKSSPRIQIAEEIKKLRDDWKNVPGGRKRLAIDSFDAADRERQREEDERWRAEMREKRARESGDDSL